MLQNNNTSDTLNTLKTKLQQTVTNHIEEITDVASSLKTILEQDPNYLQTIKNESPLFFKSLFIQAAFHNQVEIATHLLQLCTNADEVKDLLTYSIQEGKNALIFAALNGHIDIVKLLYVTCGNYWGEYSKLTECSEELGHATALHLAAWEDRGPMFRSHKAVVAFLIATVDKDALYIKTLKQHIPLHFVVLTSNSELVTQILQRMGTLDIGNYKNCVGVTPLQYAVIKGQLDNVKLLMEFANQQKPQGAFKLACSASVNLLTALVDAVQNKHFDIAAYLMQWDDAEATLLKKQDIHGRTALMKCISGDRFDSDADSFKFASLLLSTPAAASTITMQDQFGNTALHYAAERGFERVSALLINTANDKKAYIQQQNLTGYTALHFSMIQFSVLNMLLLLCYGGGAELAKIQDKIKGATALHLLGSKLSWTNGQMLMFEIVQRIGSALPPQIQLQHLINLKQKIKSEILLWVGGRELAEIKSNGGPVLNLEHVTFPENPSLKLLAHNMLAYVAAIEIDAHIFGVLLKIIGDDPLNEPILAYAVIGGNWKIVQLLLTRDTEKKFVDERYEDDKTALILASMHERNDIVDLLLQAAGEKAADFANKQDKDGKTALNYAKEQENTEAITSLSKYESSNEVLLALRKLGFYTEKTGVTTSGKDELPNNNNNNNNKNL